MSPRLKWFWKPVSKVVLDDVLVVVCLLLSFSQTAESACPYGWKDYPGSLSCYLMNPARYRFDTAVDQCTAHQGQLITIDDQNETNWLSKEIQRMRTTGLPPNMAWWIGLEDKGQGVKYLNGSDINMDLLPWSGGVAQTSSTSRRCGSIMNGKVYLSNCSSWYGFVCERSKALPLQCDVENEWTFINGSCFRYFPSQMTWYLAKSTCEQFEADLPKVTTAEEVAFIWDKIKISSKLSWIGLKSNITTRTYTWTDGSALDSSLMWWIPSQPQDLTYMMYSDPDFCGLISGNGTRRLSSWTTENCNERHSFTCSKPQGICADGWISHQSICFKFFPKYLLSWSSARQYCQSMEGDLIIIPTQSYQDLVNLYLKELSDAGVDSFWLGIEGSANQTFGWVDHKYNLSWTNWAAGVPRDNPEIHQVVAFISTGDKYGKWQMTSDPSTLRSFACFISGTKPVKDVPPPTDVTCPDQWEVAGDTCVFVSYNGATWSQANNDCQQLQSQLMVVNSAAAQSFLNNRITAGQFWIGLSDRQTEGTFIWVNGTKLDLANWADGQPDNKGNENCVIAKSSLDEAKWYDLACEEENNYICQRQPLNKSGSTYPETTASPVPYSAKCGIFWEDRPGTNFCYQFRDMALSWSDALETCSSFNGSLVSIVSRDEQSYIEGRLSSLTPVDFWIGASDRRREAGWHWEDGSPFAYLNWSPGEPNDRTTEDCVALNTVKMMWYDYPCNRRIGFVCKKVADYDLTTPTPVATIPTALPAGQYYGCPLGWLSYENSCYLARKMSATWMDAQIACRQEGAALASISSDLENKFIWSQLPKESCQNAHSNDSQCQAWADANECQKNPSWMSVNCRMSCSLCTQTCSDKYTHYECRFWARIGECLKNPDWMWENCALSCGCDTSINQGFWLGLNDRHSQMSFVWDDLSPVTFTNWLPNEPNNYLGKNEDCVKMHTTDGEWSDEQCDQKNTGYICEKKMAVLDTPTISPDKIGCPIAGFAYGSTCFVIIDSPKTWLDAKGYCSMKNATLATIPDSITGAFITSELVHKTSSYWIGLSSIAGTYRWDSGSDIEYLAWSPSHTGNENNSCVAMRSQKPVGLWEDLKCQSLQPFICETYRRGFTQAATTTSVPTTLTQCLPTWSDYENHCYKMFFSPRNWFDAQAACEGYGGSLVSLHDDNTNVFIKSLTGWNLAGGFWIGLNDRDVESSYVWSDGSPFEYSKWAKGEPNSATLAEDCVEELAATMDWNDINCYLSRAYACAIVRGVPLPTAIATVSTTEAPQCTEAGWWFHDGSCYYFSPEYGKNASVTWFESRRLCQSMGADLVSIASEDENNFLITELSRREMSMFWISLNQLQQTSYVWADGSPQSFVAWGPNEPNNFMGGERCVAMVGDRGIWQDEECMADHGYVCKKSNETSASGHQVTTATYIGSCPEGFVSGGVNSKCYYIGGLGNQTTDDPKRDWEDARNFCRSLTSPMVVDIGSIHTLADQDFATSLLYNLKGDLWIGFSDRLVANQYRWQDNSEVTYTNWASGQPARHFLWSLNKDNCVEMLRNPHRAEDTAKWNDAPCSKKSAFLCQTLQSPGPTSSPPSSTLGSSSTPVCPTDFFLYKSTCYSVRPEMQTWPDARNSCQTFGGDLASTLDIFEFARLDLALLASGITGQAWIGLKFDQISSQYVFSDGWPVKHTFWSTSNPDLQTNESCVALYLASWNDTLCSELLPYICEIKLEAPPAPTSAPAGECPDTGQVPFGDYCYVAKLNDQVSWPEASYKCGLLGMQMASVHSDEESSFLKGYVEHVAVPSTDFGSVSRGVWLGLQKDLQGGYRWSDESPVTYFNWDVGEPSTLNSRWADEECVALRTVSGQWNDLPCLGQKLGYVCKISKINLSTSSATTEPSQTSLVASAGAVTTVVTGPHATENITNLPGTSPSSRQSSSHVSASIQSPLALDENTLSAGKVAGIVIGILGFLIIVAAVISIIKNRNLPGKYKHFPKEAQAPGYDNALYTQEQDVQSGEITGEVTIGPSDSHRQSIELDCRVESET
ncbi:hypothetical protein BsWGS_25402 [Bradybaena similaris]